MRYKDACPENPSLTKLKELLPEKAVIMSVTLKPYVQGYSEQFNVWLERALNEGIAINQVFYDQYSDNFIRL